MKTPNTRFDRPRQTHRHKCRNTLALFFAAAFLWLGTAPARGDNPADDPAVRIVKATAIIEAKDSSPEQVAAALVDRGIAYDDQSDAKSAIVDYTAACWRSRCAIAGMITWTPAKLKGQPTITPR
jgi:hypothetical protein